MKPHFKEAFNLQSNSHFKTIDEGSLISFQYKVSVLPILTSLDNLNKIQYFHVFLPMAQEFPLECY